MLEVLHLACCLLLWCAQSSQCVWDLIFPGGAYFSQFFDGFLDWGGGGGGGRGMSHSLHVKYKIKFN